MSPTVLWVAGFRLFFFSREETRMHVHIEHVDGGAKFWIEPQIAMAYRQGLTDRQIASVERIVRRHEDDIRRAWKRHFEND